MVGSNEKQAITGFSGFELWGISQKIFFIFSRRRTLEKISIKGF
jgi:hypothetical protein